MIHTKIVLVVVALTAPGSAAWAGQDPVDAPAADAAAPAPAEQYVLLRDGRLVKGVVTEKEDEDAIVVTQAIGAMTYRGSRIEKVCASIREVHEYKCSLVPDDDPDEQMKLAQWCLTNGLEAEARGHLALILKLSPKHKQALAMRGSLDQTQARLAKAQQKDDGVRQAGGDVEDPGPAALDPAIVLKARRGMGLNDLPVVFDLPPNAAIKRAEEFKRFVQPVLQLHCAKCHDERHDGTFQLVQIAKRADQTAEALRANLDATLRLVDRQEPGKSELLSSSLRPHGGGRNPRPVFRGSNDKAYQILSAWVNNLRTGPAAHPLAGAPARPAAGDGDDDGEGFAVDRSRITRSTVAVDPITGEATSAPPPIRRHFETPTMKYQPGTGWVDDQGAEEAPVPFAVSGKMPRTAAAARPAPADDAVAPTSTAGPASPSGRGPKLSEDVAQALAEAEAKAAGGAPPLPVDDEESPAPAKAKPAKPMKLDPKLLQKALEKKNGAGG